MIMQQPTSGPVPVSKVQPFIGLDQAFNVAVNHIASRLCPTGYDTGKGPENLADLRYYYKRTKRLMVSMDYSDPELTIFGCRETNYAFRAWHDWHHLKLSAPFNLDGKTTVANAQADDLLNLYGAATSCYWRELLEIEVVGQACYMEYHGQFPTHQIGFTRHMLANGSFSRVFH